MWYIIGNEGEEEKENLRESEQGGADEQRASCSSCEKGQRLLSSPC
jgi:hypothetical protein